MKKSFTFFLALALCLCLMTSVFAGAESTVRSAQSFTVDGTAVDCEKYNIDGSNYFKLRDLAYLMNGTPCRFSVGFDSASGTVSVETGKDYIPIGGELVIGQDKTSTSVPSGQTILIDGKKVSDLSVYNIGGNNYFKLRDLGAYVGFGVDYDPSTNTAIVTTSGGRSVKPVWLLMRASSDLGETVYTYDSEGRLIRAKNTDSSGAVETTVYTYDSYGRKASEKVSLREGGSLTTVYAYDANGRKISETITGAGGVSSVAYEYDSSDNLISQTGTAPDGSRTYNTYTYDQAGHRLSWEHSVPGGGSFVYTYNAAGDKLSEVDRDSSGKVILNYILSYTYDGSGRKLTESRRSVSGGVSEYTAVYTYDEAGGYTRKETSAGGTVTQISYNEKGDILSQKITDLVGTVMSRVCTYDANGNLIRDVIESRAGLDKVIRSVKTYEYSLFKK